MTIIRRNAKTYILKGFDGQHLYLDKNGNFTWSPNNISNSSDCVIITPKDLFVECRMKTTFDENIQLNLEPKLLNYDRPKSANLNCVELIPQSSIEDPLIYRLSLNIKKQLEFFSVKSKLYVDSAATFLVVYLLRNNIFTKLKQNNYTEGLSFLQLRKVLDYIQNHLHETISLDSLAMSLDLSIYYFCRLFKKSTGLSPYQYVIRCRVERAKELLQESDLNLAEIATNCGFFDQSHFNRHFKNWTGVTPKQFLNL
jgi:AraC family transcriptional regulator